MSVYLSDLIGAARAWCISVSTMLASVDRVVCGGCLSTLNTWKMRRHLYYTFLLVFDLVRCFPSSAMRSGVVCVDGGTCGTKC